MTEKILSDDELLAIFDDYGTVDSAVLRIFEERVVHKLREGGRLREARTFWRPRVGTLDLPHGSNRPTITGLAVRDRSNLFDVKITRDCLHNCTHISRVDQAQCSICAAHRTFCMGMPPEDEGVTLSDGSRWRSVQGTWWDLWDTTAACWRWAGAADYTVPCITGDDYAKVSAYLREREGK